MMAPIGQCERCGHDIPVKEPSTPGKQRTRWCSTKCMKRAWDAQRQTCPRCSGEMSRQGERCKACENEIRQQAYDARVQDVASMYSEGMSMKEIASRLGYAEGSEPGMLLREARRRGLIAYRYDRARVDASREARWGE